MPPIVRRTFAFAALAVLLGACQLSVGIDTTVDPSGRGTLALTLGMDEELLATARADAAEMRAFDSLFEALAARGWEVTRDEPDGGLEVRASRAFDGPEGYRAALEEMRKVVAANPSSLLGEMGLDLKLKVHKGLFQTRASLSGEIDTTGGVRLDPNLLSAVSDLVRFEVGASLPGEMRATSGEASGEGTRLVWRPVLGEKARLGAASEALRLGPVFAALFVSLALVTGGVGALVSRRRRAAAIPRAKVIVLPDASRSTASGDRSAERGDRSTARGDADLVLNAKPIDVEALLAPATRKIDPEPAERGR